MYHGQAVEDTLERSILSFDDSDLVVSSNWPCSKCDAMRFEIVGQDTAVIFVVRGQAL